ncbi:hypothetical protein [Virgibacillus alimentarius]|uniref:ABC transporter periplasmic binding protein yphF n=1 Tax=Virgibacillus alimentarius TaxID=698769 RepID=A0ABS4S4I3_9BACI|nr:MULTISPECIES: hypothetical protein [Virgibacillus]MBP2256388.1 hypothetical protein [Virgibacillus alimentarius]HLR66333.1 hypothetical protein [Virgibacillus sp.]
MKYTYVRLFSLLFMLFILSGCLYPQSELSKNQSPNEAQLELVQTAVDKYKEQTNGLVPIKTKESNSPIFQKYLIDFNALKEQNTLAEIPGNAYENGGVYQYTIITPEDNPRVKLIDLRSTEELRKVNIKLEIYRDKHIYPPFGEEIANGIFKIDYKKLGLKSEPSVVSPYSKENLPIIMDTDGQLYIDYRIDLNNALKEYDNHYKKGEDIRTILPENTPFVPAYSLPYTVDNGEPVFLEQNK